MKKRGMLLAAGALLVTSLLPLGGAAVAAETAAGATAGAGSTMEWSVAGGTTTVTGSSAETAAATAVTYELQGLKQPWGLTAAASRDELLVVSAGSNTIGRWNGAEGKLSIAAGSGAAGYIDGEAAAAAFRMPSFAATDAKGNVYISDTDNHVIRKFAGGKLTTLAGNGEAGYSDGKQGEARFSSPTGIAVDAEGNVYVADTLNHVIRRITPEGAVSTFAGQAPSGETGDYVDGAAAQARFNEPTGLAFDETGRLFVADSGNHIIRVIDKGEVTTLAGQKTAVDPLTGYRTGGYQNGAAADARFNRPRGLAYADGVLFVADSLNHRIRAVTANGRVVTLAGKNAAGDQIGTVEQAQFNQPSGVFYRSGKLYISDPPNGNVKALAVNPAQLQPVRNAEDLLSGVDLKPAGASVQLWLDGKQLASGPAPYMSGNKVYIPVRSVFAAWGAELIWHAATKTAELRKGDWSLSIKPDSEGKVVITRGVLYIEASHLESLTSFLAVYDTEYRAAVLDSGQ
ncbi:NHL repeat-containing protein [Paenibacillus algorifonticola]|uniref:NHL repeat-containing protein n=1 Tax=Paenibacillus algorifonticola TaxID=684063 RepID=A0A1I2D7E8_9BACL|nr:SMP-30/gluconolactonase/LRE family protein [Paenibacillus algorifonticola]SFE76482.1 NHL repeat-containing protein [Paenibacillus algorifonticola]